MLLCTQLVSFFVYWVGCLFFFSELKVIFCLSVASGVRNWSVLFSSVVGREGKGGRGGGVRGGAWLFSVLATGKVHLRGMDLCG